MNEAIQFLKAFQQERNTQPNDGNANPVFWVLRDYKWEVTEEGYEDRVSLYDVNRGEPIEMDEYVNEILNGERKVDFTEELIEELDDSFELYGPGDVLEWIQNHTDDNVHLIYEKETDFIVPDTLFLTKKEAKKHIELNRHHYTDNIHTYAMTALRSPVVEQLLNILETFDWDSIGGRNKQYAHCMVCDYETESLSEKDLIYKISIEGGYIQSDKDGGYYSKCPSCESSNLSLMSS